MAKLVSLSLQFVLFTKILYFLWWLSSGLFPFYFNPDGDVDGSSDQSVDNDGVCDKNATERQDYTE